MVKLPCCIRSSQSETSLKQAFLMGFSVVPMAEHQSVLKCLPSLGSTTECPSILKHLPSLVPTSDAGVF